MHAQCKCNRVYAKCVERCLVTYAGGCSHCILTAAKLQQSEDTFVKPWDTMTGWGRQIGDEELVPPSESELVAKTNAMKIDGTLPTAQKVHV